MEPRIGISLNRQTLVAWRETARRGEKDMSFFEELQAQVEKLEKEILEAEAAGKDCGGDRVAGLHLKELIKYLPGQVTLPPIGYWRRRL
jgi:hypothetical protein